MDAAEWRCAGIPETSPKPSRKSALAAPKAEGPGADELAASDKSAGGPAKKEDSPAKHHYGFKLPCLLPWSHKPADQAAKTKVALL